MLEGSPLCFAVVYLRYRDFTILVDTRLSCAQKSEESSWSTMHLD